MASFWKKVGKAAGVVAGVAAVWYTGGAALQMYSQYAQSRAALKGRPTPNPEPIVYSAPFNPGYSYTGPPEAYYGSGAMAGGSTGGAAVPIVQSGGDGAPSGFSISPFMAIGALVVILFGFLLLRR